MSTENTKVYTPEEFATKFGLKPASVRKMLREKRLPGFKLGGAWRVLDSDLETLRNIRPTQQPVERPKD